MNMFMLSSVALQNDFRLDHPELPMIGRGLGLPIIEGVQLSSPFALSKSDKALLA